MRRPFDVVVVGAGVIGTAVARSFALRKISKSIAILEKEEAPAQHTSGRNSGVLHSGFNLKPGSLKAKFCVEGNARLSEFCRRRGLPFEPVGTVVVAQAASEMTTLEELLERGKANGVPGLHIVDEAGLRRLEPYAKGMAALHSPSGSIASGKLVTQALADEAVSLGCQFFFRQKVRSIEPLRKGYRIRTQTDEFDCERLVNCAGLYADEVAHLLDVGQRYTIIPFRGEYYRMQTAKRGVLRSMLYPVPDLAYPFLGVHWTKSITGDVLVGPNATMAFGRESYHPFKINIPDSLKMLTKKNFWKLWASRSFRRLAWSQFRISFNKNLFIREAQRLIPDVSVNDFIRGKSGNRAQLVDDQGHLVEDMMVERKGNSLHVLNAVSPGFTCSLPFADYLVDQLAT